MLLRVAPFLLDQVAFAVCDSLRTLDALASAVLGHLGGMFLVQIG